MKKNKLYDVYVYVGLGNFIKFGSFNTKRSAIKYMKFHCSKMRYKTDYIFRERYF